MMMSPRIELTRIREAYQYMGDEELLIFAKEEGLKLSTDAYLILKEELQKRTIGADILQQLEHEIILHYSLRQKRFEEDLHKDLFISSLEFALSAKHRGTSQYDIYAGLIERGINDDYASYMVNKLDEWALKLHKESTVEIQTGAGIFLLGIMVLCITVKIQRFEMAGAMIVITGLGRMLLSWNRKKKFKKIIDTILLENPM
jgi:hypothetical protein